MIMRILLLRVLSCCAQSNSPGGTVEACSGVNSTTGSSSRGSSSAVSSHRRLRFFSLPCAAGPPHPIPPARRGGPRARAARLLPPSIPARRGGHQGGLMSRIPRQPFDYFFQLFAQAMNAPIDPIREANVISTCLVSLLYVILDAAGSPPTVPIR